MLLNKPLARGEFRKAVGTVGKCLCGIHERNNFHGADDADCPALDGRFAFIPDTITIKVMPLIADNFARWFRRNRKLAGDLAQSSHEQVHLA